MIKRCRNEAELNKAMEARKAYKREWQRANRDKVQAQQMRYWLKKAEALEANQGDH